jgi:hypothetical protein
MACNPESRKVGELQTKIDSLENRLNQAYVPGFGEFMSSIQVHHNKLWFAGINRNWQLADFEIHEIMETVGNIQKYQTARKESKEIDILLPVLDSVGASIRTGDEIAFRKNFNVLTETCNTCHKQNDFGFNVVKIPDSPPFTNQVFKPAH